MSELSEKFKAACEFDDDICDSNGEWYIRQSNLKPIHAAVEKVIEAAEIKGCSDEVRLSRIDKALATLAKTLE